jgi:hypothetical protein
METPDHIDGERRRVKQRLLWKILFRRQTLRVLLALVPLLTKLVQLVIAVINIFRE